MAEIEGTPYWPVTFDEHGTPINGPDGGADELERALPGSGVTDLLVFCHGWNNSTDDADRLFRSMFGLLPEVVGSSALRSGVVLGLVGVHWPSMLFPDAAPPGTPSGPKDGSALTAAIAPAFPTPPRRP